MVIDPNTQPFNNLDLVGVPHGVPVTQEVSERWHPVLLRRVDSRIQCHRQWVRRHELPGLDGSRIPRVQADQLLRALLDVVEYPLYGRDLHHLERDNLRPAQDGGERFFRCEVRLFDPGLFRVIPPLGDRSRATE